MKEVRWKETYHCLNSVNTKEERNGGLNTINKMKWRKKSELIIRKIILTSELH